MDERELKNVGLSTEFALLPTAFRRSPLKSEGIDSQFDPAATFGNNFTLSWRNCFSERPLNKFCAASTVAQSIRSIGIRFCARFAADFVQLGAPYGSTFPRVIHNC